MMEPVVDGEQRGGADPVHDEVNVHADVARNLAVPVTRALIVVEAKLEGILVVHAGEGAVNTLSR